MTKGPPHDEEKNGKAESLPSPKRKRHVPGPVLFGKIEMPHAEVKYEEVKRKEGDPLDPECEHIWLWESGVKTCRLCGGMAPLDRRDSSTRWKR